MIRSTLFKSVAPALRDSLNDAEVVALGMWLLMSAGAYLRGVAMFAKDGAGTEELEAVATAKYVYPEGTPQEELMIGGMTNPDYRLPTANRMTAANVIANLEDLMYTIATSNEERDNPHRNAEAPPMPQPIPNGMAEWRANPFVERTIPAPPQENRLVGRERAMADIPRFDTQPITQRAHAEAVINFEVQAEQGAVAMQARLANEEHQRQVRDFLRIRDVAERAQEVVREGEAAADMRIQAMRERMMRERQAEIARLDELANRTRGIPNRR